MTLELELDVPDSREVTLPPEVPVGRVKLTVRPPEEQVVEFHVTLPDDPPLPPTADKFEREKAAFRRLLPELLKTHRGQYVAIHEETVVETGTDRLSVALATMRRVGPVDLYVDLVTDDPPRVLRIAGPRLVRAGGAK